MMSPALLAGSFSTRLSRYLIEKKCKCQALGLLCDPKRQLLSLVNAENTKQDRLVFL